MKEVANAEGPPRRAAEIGEGRHGGKGADMNVMLPLPGPGPVVYPESDGLPMADNTKQGRWIILIYDNLEGLYHDDPDKFVAQNHLWYPKEGEREIRIGPDVYVVFGRPKGDRGSYRQWEEGDVPLTVVFEILSPGNTYEEMDNKRLFYEEYGVEEYYVYDPEVNSLLIFVRRGSVLARVRPAHGFVSPRLGIRFDLSGPELVIFHPDGQPFRSWSEVEARRRAAEENADKERRRSARLAELSRKARRGQASAEELAELERLEDEAAPPSA
jgi:Uma2 family endonuclease